MKKFLILIVIFISLGLNVKSQSVTPFVIASAGSYFVSANAQLSWTLGEVITSTFISGNSILTQGFQQNNYVVIAINEFSDNPFKIDVYPNPSSRFINIQWANIEQMDLLFEIINNQGVCIIKKIINSSENQLEIDLNNFSNSTYILYVTPTNGDWVRYFKIIKN
jgi:hypothetical protein